MWQATSGFSAADRQVPCSSLSLAAISRMRSVDVVRCAMKTLAIPGTGDVAFRRGGPATDAGAAYAVSMRSTTYCVEA